MCSKREQFDMYWEDRYDCAEELVGMGFDAIAFLLEKATQGTSESSEAATMLCRIGVADERVIQTFREEVSQGGLAVWGAKTLGILGDMQWLLEAASTPSTRHAAVLGIIEPLRSFINYCPHAAPLTYQFVEALLDQDCEQCTAIVEEELAPGASLRDITVAEVDEALRGLNSRHPIVRRHAAMVLGGGRFGAVAKKKIAPALVDRFQDSDRQVKRLSVLSLSYLPKSAAKPFRENLEALLDDPDLDVILFARRTLEKIN